jgi:portal protein
MTDGSVKDYDAALQELEDHYDANGLTAETGALRIAKDKEGNPRIRETVSWKVLWVKIDGARVLEGPYLYDWKRIPVIRCPGRYVNIEGRKKLQSLIRHAKDAQRTYNSRCSDMIERSALIPKAPYLVTQDMIKGYENEWNQANTQSRPYLPYNIDPKAPDGGMPFRTPPIDVPQGAMALADQALKDIQAATGYFDPALGNAEDMNRVSGKALVQHTRRSDLGSYEFVDGFQAALQLTWDIFIDMIPATYDSQRVVRVMGRDGSEDIATIMQMGHDGNLINDLRKGRYDVTVTIGPSFQTQRQETLQTLIDAAESIPMVAQFCPDLLAKNLDSPDATEMQRRLRIPLIMQGIIKPNEGDEKSIPQQTPQQQAQAVQQQLNQAKLQKATADAQIAQSKAGASHLEGLRLMYETAGKHLANLLAAKKLGEPGEADEAEAEATQPQPQGQQSAQAAA